MVKDEKMKKRYEALFKELRDIGEFRRGSVNVFYRKCGKENCVCNREGHPGHGPQRTLTYKHKGRTISRNLPSPEAEGIVREQTKNRRRFMEWLEKFRGLNEEMSDMRLESVLSEQASEDEGQKKKFQRRSRRRSSVRSRG